MNNIKRISLMTATFLTVALISSAVEAGVIPINGTIAGSEIDTPFPDPAEGFYVNASSVSTDTQLGPFTLFQTVPVAFAFFGTPPGNTGGTRLIVGDAANGDSILTWTLAGAQMITYLAMIAAWVGEKDLACEQLARAIRYPNAVSYGELKLMSDWDPLRGDPRSEKIFASLEASAWQATDYTDNRDG